MTNQNTYPQKTKYDSLAKKLYLLFSSRRLTSKQKFATLPLKDKDYWRALAEISIKEKLWQTQELSP
jgi:hypothetical protein